MNLDDQGLLESELRELRALLARGGGGELTLERLWALGDEVWDDLGCDNRVLDSARVAAYYGHPFWLLSGLYSELDPVSRGHRERIADWVLARRPEISRVIDYGGGFGTLARILAARDPSLTVHVYEPSPTRAALERASRFPNLRYVAELAGEYDCLISTDVLEHVPDPLDLLARVARHVREDGYLVIANCFHPVVKCHVPSTFHLRYTFAALASRMGIRPVEHCAGSHAAAFRKAAATPRVSATVRALERLSRAAFPALTALAWARRRVRRIASEP